MEIVLATNNKGKFIEMTEVLSIPGIEFVPMSEFDIPDIEETGNTFYENALIKACTVNDITGLPTIADDSGLEIEALDDFPGIFSARCAGENATDEEKRNFILEKMKNIENRNARFVSHIVFKQSKEIDRFYFIGVCKGHIIHSPKGIAKPGLQYDSIFLADGLRETFAEISHEDKNKISHRGKALKRMKCFLETQDFLKASLIE